MVRQMLFAVVALTPTTLFAGVLTVATFNCEFLIRDKIEMKFGESAISEAERDKKFSQGVAAVAKVIKRTKSDVIGLTEVGDEDDVEQLRLAIIDDTGDPIYPHKAVCKSFDRSTGQHVAILSKFPLSDIFKTIPGREFYDEELDDPEEENSTGVSKGMKAMFEFDGHKIHFYVIHLISEIQGFESDAKRVAQVSIVRRNYLQFLNKGEHVIVVGDMNARRGTPTLRRVRGRDDIFGDLLQTGNTKTVDKKNWDQRWTYVWKGRKHQLDHVLPSWSVKEACSKIRARSFDVETTLPNGKKASDHRPFLVTFKFKN